MQDEDSDQSIEEDSDDDVLILESVKCNPRRTEWVKWYLNLKNSVIRVESQKVDYTRNGGMPKHKCTIA